MTHNKLTIGTATSDRTSSLSTNLSDLDDVSSTAPNTNEFLQWSGSEWTPASMSSGANLNAEVVAWAGDLNGGGYSIGPNVQPAVGAFYFMALGYINSRCKYYHNATSATWYTNTGYIIAVNNTGWVDRVQLTAGTYALRATHRTGGWADVQWQTEGGVALSPIRRIASREDACNVIGMINTSTTVKVGLRIIAKSGSLTAPNSTDNFYLHTSVLEIK